MLCISTNPKMKNEKWLYIAISKINIVNDQDKQWPQIQLKFST